MNRVLAVLAVVGTSLCYRHGWSGMFGRHWGRFHHLPRHNHYFMMNPTPPYLQDVSDEAGDEFYEIMNSMGITLSQQKEAIRQWADRHKILEEVQKFNTKIEERKSEMKARAAKLARDLPNALDKFWSIMENRSYTPLDQRYALKKLNYEDPPLYNVMKFAIEQFLPLYHPYERQSGHGGFYRYQDGI